MIEVIDALYVCHMGMYGMSRIDMNKKLERPWCIPSQRKDLYSNSRISHDNKQHVFYFLVLEKSFRSRPGEAQFKTPSRRL